MDKLRKLAEELRERGAVALATVSQMVISDQQNLGDYAKQLAEALVETADEIDSLLSDQLVRPHPITNNFHWLETGEGWLLVDSLEPTLIYGWINTEMGRIDATIPGHEGEFFHLGLFPSVADAKEAVMLAQDESVNPIPTGRKK